MKKIEVYELEDGQIFKDFSEATNEEKYLNFSSWYNDNNHFEFEGDIGWIYPTAHETYLYFKEHSEKILEFLK